MSSWSDAERTVEFDDEGYVAPDDDQIHAGPGAAAADERLREDRPPHWDAY